MNSRYLQLSGKRLGPYLDRTVAAIKNLFPKAQAIAFRGMSGALIAPSVAIKLGLLIVVVRKSNSDTHSCSIVEGSTAKKLKYVIVDDFIASGRTIRDILKEMKKFNSSFECLGMVCYNKIENNSQRVIKRIEEEVEIKIISV